MAWTITLKRLYLAPPNLAIFCEFGRILAKSIHQGVAAVVFEMRRLKKLNKRIFCFTSKPWKCRGGGGGINVCQERCFQALKVIFLEFYSIPGSNNGIAMTRSILERTFLRGHISKSRKANNLKFLHVY